MSILFIGSPRFFLFSNKYYLNNMQTTMEGRFQFYISCLRSDMMEYFWTESTLKRTGFKNVRSNKQIFTNFLLSETWCNINDNKN